MGAEEIPAIGFVAPSGSGKTTLLRKLVPLLRRRGLRVGYLKHAHHGFALDRPGKDSYEIAAAGARQVMLVSGQSWALLSRNNQRAADHPDGLDGLRARFDTDALDLLLIEGFREATVPKVEVYRAATGQAPLYPADDRIIAVCTDDALDAPSHLRVLPLSEPTALADFVVEQTVDGRQLGPRGGASDPREALIGCLTQWSQGGRSQAELGSASVRQAEGFWIAPETPGLDTVEVADLVHCGLVGALPSAAPVAAVVHRAAYRAAPEIGALLHSRRPYSLVLSLAGSDLSPIDAEGARLLGQVPVLRLGQGTLEGQAAAAVATALSSGPVCLVSGDGCYAAAETLSEACRWTERLELSARILCIAQARSMGAIGAGF